MADSRWDVVAELDKALLEMIPKVSQTSSYSEDVLRLAEARAWLASPSQPHGSSAVSKD